MLLILNYGRVIDICHVSFVVVVVDVVVVYLFIYLFLVCLDFCCLECYFYVDVISLSAYWVFIIGYSTALITTRLNRVLHD